MKRPSGYQKASNEAALKVATLERDQCICYICGTPGADQADHVIPVAEGGAHDLSNRRAIHAVPCHARKTQAEAARGRARARQKWMRQPEPHPGLTMGATPYPRRRPPADRCCR